MVWLWLDGHGLALARVKVVKGENGVKVRVLPNWLKFKYFCGFG